MNENQNTSLVSLVQYPDDVINVIKTNSPAIAEQIEHYHQTKHQETLNAVANLNPENDTFKEKYKYLTQLAATHLAATKIWKA